MSADNAPKVQGKYGLRPRTIIKRLQLEKSRQELCKKTPKMKCRPAPLSKYRRKTANARERHRMREINTAFESLRKALPDFHDNMVSSTMTKITTLKLAVQYIEALSRVLDSDTPDYCRSSSPLGAENDHRGKLYAGQNFIQADHIATAYGERDFYQLKDESTSYTISTPDECLVHSTSLSLSISDSSSSSYRRSRGSVSDLDDLLSDDSTFLDDNLDVFHDIPVLPGPDPFELLL